MNKLKTVSNVLRMKEHKKEELEAEVRRLRHLIKKEQQMLESLQSLLTETVTMYENKQETKSVSAQELELYSDYIARLFTEMEAQRVLISKRIKEIMDIQNALLNAYREKKLFETLKGNIIRDNLKLHEKRIQQEMDFLFLSKRRLTNEA